jgi:bacillithiol biosynthesis deacetylase BshB1
VTVKPADNRSELRPCDIVAFTAHPDDLELNASGTLALAVEEGWTAAAVDFTRGELSTRGTPEARAREAEAAARILGLSVRLNLGLPDGGLRDTDENRARVVRLLRRLRPRVVIAPPLLDHHADHMGVAEIVSRSVYLAGVEKYAPGEEPWRPRALLHYLGSRAAVPTLVVDVTRVYEKRLAAIHCFESQFFRAGSTERATRISHPRFLDAVDGAARRYGALIGCPYGEAYTSAEPVAVRDVVALFAAAPREDGS